ncbi:Glucodextranase N [Catenulispora acidiphila DSM 44928]|uniref:alpha-amylase n=1 Tax=Catenulispora acidiphila (strain DSM 44928 / JCM 14897 / NBRC 102108 / NRRL B-24433 / ID139908) TaxID=479433 RepID=C7Q6X1_CATAD|nr:glycoside hydrolase family 15 protein [Catenulispora acidiphila]ACU75984.1 Glucodextranase N [Catenulispora acidiphila DSM 44928]
MLGRFISPPRVGRRWLRSSLSAFAGLSLATVGVWASSSPVARAGTASGGPGTASFWNETSGVQGFATALSPSSKVWYTLGNGGLENVFYPQTDNPDTYGLQYYVTDGSSFTDGEATNTKHAIALADPASLTFTQTNTAASGKYAITKTYVADPARSVILVKTTFTNNGSTPLYLYADYLPQLNNQGMGNIGSTDAGGDLVASNGPMASALAASTPFSSASTGYVGTASSGTAQLATGHTLGTVYSGVSSSGHIDQTAQIPVAASGSTTFTLALGFDTTSAAAVSDVSASLSSGFAAVQSSFQAGWHTWMSGLTTAPASVANNAGLLTQYETSLMEVKADEDKNYVGAFVAAPVTPWGSTVSADGGGGHGYHLVWTRDEYQMASALLAAGDKQDASDALTYLENYEETSSGQVKQNTWLNGNAMWGGNQQDEEADPIILAYQLGRTGSADFAKIKLLASFIAANGPTTGQERWEENGGYSPATIASEIAGLVCASNIATANGDSADAAAWLAKAQSWAGSVAGWTYTTSGPYGSGSYFLRLTPDGQPNSGASIGLANGGGNHDDRTVVDQSFLDLVRLGVMPATASQVTNSLAVDDAQIGVNTPEGQIDHRYDFDGYGETSSGADYTGAGTGNPWPVLTGERGEYDVAAGNLTGAQSALTTMAGAASDGQISEQVWAGTNGTGGFSLGRPDNSANPLMWAMAQYVRLAMDISAGQNLDTPTVVCQTFNACSAAPTTKPAAPTNLTVTATHTTNVSLSWSGSSLAAGYKVYRATGTGPAALVATVASTAYTDTKLTASTAYSYSVTAYNNVGESGPSNTVTTTTKTPVPPPNAPTGLTVSAAASTTVDLTWTAATDTSGGTVGGYNIYRATGTGTAALVASTSGTSFTDTGLTPSTGYTYSVTATDTDGNESAASNSVTATTTANNVEVVTVTVPSYTDQTGLTVYMAGTLSALGGGQGDWAANGIAFTRVDATHWRATIHAAGPTTLSYKYTLGGAWANDEETASCGYVGNRSMQINGGTEADTVANWAGPYTCGSSPPPPPGGGTGGNGGTTETIAVTVPADTPASAQVYLAGNLSVLGGGQGDWAANGVLMSRVDATHFTASVSAANASTTLQYKYTLNGTWSNNEETGSCGYVQNRSLTVNGGTQTDTVANWKGYGGC